MSQYSRCILNIYSVVWQHQVSIAHYKSQLYTRRCKFRVVSNTIPPKMITDVSLELIRKQ